MQSVKSPTQSRRVQDPRAEELQDSEPGSQKHPSRQLKTLIRDLPDLCFLRERSGGTLENAFAYETPASFFIPRAGGNAVVVFANRAGAGAGGTSWRSTTGDNPCLEGASTPAAPAPEHPGGMEIEPG